MKVISHLLHFVLPNYCWTCSTKLNIHDTNCFCQSCWEKIKLTGKNYCQKCAKAIITSEGVCHECQNRKIFYDEIRSVGIYEDILKEAIHLYKFSSRWKMAFDFIQLINENIDRPYLQENDFFIPVPLTQQRLQERGFHQTYLITKHLGKKWNKLSFKDVLQKKKNTKPQSTLTNREERIHNLRDSFIINKKHIDLIKNKNILLFDDVYTTGTTINECSKVLKQNGVNNIKILVLGRG